eukprot:gnl/Trimastix_PCT/2715.p1 GENE.gnl/Trimastix_PCT/2715~~gnl/Trimastix_PCT/2715.p1  ORF type:complete len:498 (+),score=5.79 gnl/Trimastix_PCT/2715:259-1752(+)
MKTQVTPWALLPRDNAQADPIIRQISASHLPQCIRPHLDVIVGLHDFIEARRVGSPHLTFAGAGTNDLTSSPLNARTTQMEEPHIVLPPQSLLSLYRVPRDLYASHPKTSHGFFAPYKNYVRYEPGTLHRFYKKLAIQGTDIHHNHANMSKLMHDPENECDMDSQMLTGTAQRVQESWFWSDLSWYPLAHQAAHDHGFPEVLSFSYVSMEKAGCECEPELCLIHEWTYKEYQHRCNVEFMKAAARGITLVVADGDDGASPDCKTPETYYPTSSPWFTSVGGTILSRNCTHEHPRKLHPSQQWNPAPVCTTWGDDKAVHCPDLSEPFCETAGTLQPSLLMTTGGGFSWVTPQPKYQSKAVQGWLASSAMRPAKGLWNESMRGIPDISAICNRVTVLYKGREMYAGGTSASAPIIAGLVTLLNDQLRLQGRPRVGFLTPALYRMAETHPAALVDILSGHNACNMFSCPCPGYGASKGWDPVTGLGVPVFDEMLSYFMGL